MAKNELQNLYLCHELGFFTFDYNFVARASMEAMFSWLIHKCTKKPQTTTFKMTIVINRHCLIDLLFPNVLHPILFEQLTWFTK
jgi:hypothetical protein